MVISPVMRPRCTHRPTLFWLPVWMTLRAHDTKAKSIISLVRLLFFIFPHFQDQQPNAGDEVYVFSTLGKLRLLTYLLDELRVDIRNLAFTPEGFSLPPISDFYARVRPTCHSQYPPFQPQFSQTGNFRCLCPRVSRNLQLDLLRLSNRISNGRRWYDFERQETRLRQVRPIFLSIDSYWKFVCGVCRSNCAHDFHPLSTFAVALLRFAKLFPLLFLASGLECIATYVNNGTVSIALRITGAPTTGTKAVFNSPFGKFDESGLLLYSKEFMQEALSSLFLIPPSLIGEIHSTVVQTTHTLEGQQTPLPYSVAYVTLNTTLPSSICTMSFYRCPLTYSLFWPSSYHGFLVWWCW